MNEKTEKAEVFLSDEGEIKIRLVPKPKGFATLTPERRKEISSLGGKSAHAKGTAHKWTSEEAMEAGRKGGSVPKKRRGGKR